MAQPAKPTALTAKARVVSLVSRIGEIAEGALAKITWFVVVGVLASGGIAWKLYSPDSALWWNLIKCSFVLLPALIWALVWFVLSQLRAAPELVAELAEDDDGLFSNLDKFSLQEPNGLRGVASTLKEFRKEDGLSVIFDTIGGITLIANPLFAMLALLAMVVLFLLILIAPFVLLA